MEKKTIGKFISALRKANGMTQKELGEKLFVSDKTVSRRECDECTPELSLIPLIAEIFDVTTDELLRGERNNPDRDAINYEETANRQELKSDKQFKFVFFKYCSYLCYVDADLFRMFFSVIGGLLSGDIEKCSVESGNVLISCRIGYIQNIHVTFSEQLFCAPHPACLNV